MNKKTSKSKKVVKKSGTKKRGRKALDPAKVREDIAGIVKANARVITRAVVTKASQGQLAPAKYLLEMAGVFPAPADGSAPSADEESLAETLLHRLNIPTEPVVHDELAREADEEDRLENSKEELAGVEQ